VNVLTIDLEEWFHLLEYSPLSDPQEWEHMDPKLEPMTEKVLDILAEAKVEATFFILGWAARRYPGIVRRICDCGHDIGSHSDSHRLVSGMSRKEFREDLRRSIGSIEDTSGRKVLSYRAPGFSLTRESSWVFDELIDAGIETDCSIFPIKRAHGGYPGFESNVPSLVRTNEGSILELPVKPMRILGKEVVITGGGYFRFFPYSMVRAFLSQSKYSMSYFHPRDFWPDQPVLKGLPISRRLKSYWDLRTAEGKFRKMLGEFEFISLRKATKEIKQGKLPVIRTGADERACKNLLRE